MVSRVCQIWITWITWVPICHESHEFLAAPRIFDTKVNGEWFPVKGPRFQSWDIKSMTYHLIGLHHLKIEITNHHITLACNNLLLCLNQNTPKQRSPTAAKSKGETWCVLISYFLGPAANNTLCPRARERLKVKPEITRFRKHLVLSHLL